MSASPRVWKFGDDVDTDAMAPGTYMKFSMDVIAQHCLESLRPEFPGHVCRGDVIVGGRNFGVGSSREQAPQALCFLGIAVVVATSFAGIFYRNALNVGLPVVTCNEADLIADGSRIKVDYAAGRIELSEQGRVLSCEPIPAFLVEMLNDGGLMRHLRRRLNKGII